VQDKPDADYETDQVFGEMGLRRTREAGKEPLGSGSPNDAKSPEADQEETKKRDDDARCKTNGVTYPGCPVPLRKEIPSTIRFSPVQAEDSRQRAK